MGAIVKINVGLAQARLNKHMHILVQMQSWPWHKDRLFWHCNGLQAPEKLKH